MCGEEGVNHDVPWVFLEHRSSTECIGRSCNCGSKIILRCEITNDRKCVRLTASSVKTVGGKDSSLVLNGARAHSRIKSEVPNPVCSVTGFLDFVGKAVLCPRARYITAYIACAAVGEDVRPPLACTDSCSSERSILRRDIGGAFINDGSFAAPRFFDSELPK